MNAAGAIPLRRAPTNLAGLLGSIRQIMEPQAKAFDVTLSVAVDAGAPPAVFVDSDKIAWAITTLIGNALRYVRHGTQRMPGGSIALRATYQPASRDVAVDVQDDGPGMPAGRGPGLGLSMVRDVVTAHGGTFDIRTQTDASGRGTTIHLTLPAA